MAKTRGVYIAEWRKKGSREAKNRQKSTKNFKE
jgi:hypothetical protein